MRNPSFEADSDEPYFAATVDLLEQSTGGVTVRNRHDGAVHALDARQWAVVSQCGAFRTLPGHEAHLAQATGTGPEEAAGIMAGLIRAGLLRSRSGFLAAARSAPRPDRGPAAITTCGWVTRGRPEVLLRSVRSLIANNRQYGRDPDYHVYDDTPDRDACAATRVVLGALAREAGVRIHYAGVEEKARYLAALTEAAGRQGVPPEVVRFALAPAQVVGSGVPTTGANHNAMRLGAVGEALLATDDDIEVLPVRLREAREGLALTSKPSSNVLHPLADSAETEPYVTPTEVGLLAAHERLLGRTVGALLGEREDDAVHVADLRPAFAQRLESEGAQVAITMAGAYGDSGMGNARLLFVLEGAAREAALRSEERFRALTARHMAVNLAPQETVAEGIALMAMNLGLDNRELLPPSMPVYRAHDTVLAATLRRSELGRLIAHVPVGLRHAPPRPRTVTPAQQLEPRPTVGGLLALMIEPHRPSGADLAASLASLGAHLHGLVSRPAPELREWARARWVRHAELLTGHLESLLARYHGRPDYWAADVRAYLENLQRLVDDPGGPLPFDLVSHPADGADIDAAWGTVQGLVRGYAALLEAWPELVSVAQALRDQGIRPARRV